MWCSGYRLDKANRFVGWLLITDNQPVEWRVNSFDFP